MATEYNLMLAILAMDAYNRGNFAHLKTEEFSNNQIGDATFFNQKDKEAEFGFYAVTYTLGSQKIISIRGTDNPTGVEGSNDILTGYGVSQGYPDGPQATAAITYYKEIVGEGTDLRNNNVFVTGHSMGAGLAGLVGAIYGKTGPVFDHMPFEKAAAWAYTQAIDHVEIQSAGQIPLFVPADSVWRDLLMATEK